MTRGNALDPDSVLRYIMEFTKNKGYTPSLTHIQNFYGVDHNAANRVVRQLVERRDLERTDRKGVFVLAPRRDTEASEGVQG